MKPFFRAALAAVALVCLLFAAPDSKAQSPAVDSINFKGTTNIFVSRHGTGAPSPLTCTGTEQWTQDDDTTGQPIWTCKAGTMVHTSGGIAPTFTPNQGVAANAGGLLFTTPESGYSSTSGTTLKAWNEDKGLGHFDCRDTKYGPGGCLGTNPGLAMQALANDVTCYQAMTGLHANVTFPPGVIPIGTATNPTLKLPTGAYYVASVPSYTGISTQFNATYNNTLALHFLIGTTATCSDGNVHTNTLTAGRYEGFGVHGCGQGGCVNVPGDSNNYPVGGPLQDSILIEDSQGFVDVLASDHNGGNGVQVGGQDTQVRTVWGFGNMAWYYFGNKVAGQLYNPATDGWHCNVMLTSLDGTFVGPFESYGYLNTPGAEYLHVCGALWGGGNSGMGPEFSNRDQIGLVRPIGNNNGRVIGGRYDGAMGEGLWVAGAGNSFSNIDNSSACSGFSATPKGTVFGPWMSSAGTGQTPGTYTIHAVNVSGDTSGSGATLTLVVGSGGTATSVVIGNAGTLYLATPTFPVTGTGGTPAVIGGTVYHHCDKLEDNNGSGANSYSNVKNIWESFFGPDFSTGDIWTAETGGTNSTYDRGTVGQFERITGIVNEPKGNGVHKDLVDPMVPNGGIAVAGPGPNFSNGNHFISGDATPTSWTGPFTVASIMQDLWIYGGNANTTLPVSAGWQTCSGYDLSLAAAQWYHFFVYRDDVFFSAGTNFIFKEQCDSIDQNHWWLNHAGNTGSLPPLEQQGTVDSLGDIRSHALPALAGMTGQAGGIADGVHGFSGIWTYAIRVWGPWGTQTNGVNTFNQCMPAPGLVNHPCFQTLVFTLPEGTTRYRLTRETSTDSVATAGTIVDISFTAPQHITATAFADTRIAPLNSTSSGNYSANMTGGPWECGTLPPVSAYPAVLGQTCVDPVGGYYYHADTDDHWKRSALPFSNF
jgi:hypothetical protein